MTMNNMWVIASEKPDFDKEEFINWLEEHEEGYFLRDPESVLDCQYFEPTVFLEIYTFTSPDRGELFRRVVKI